MRASELLEIINDTIFEKETDKEIAINLFVHSRSNEQCAEKTGFHIRTIARRRDGIEDCLKNAISRPYVSQK